jgi:hypothetical protein
MKKLITVMATAALAMALSAVSFAQQNPTAQPSAQTPTADQPSAQQPTSDMQNGQQPSPDQQSAQPSAPSPDSPSMQATQGSSFAGTVVKAGSKYVLKTTDMNYQLDDQQKAKQYDGQQVKVNGTLDSNTSTIHVADISPAS